ncbi:MAG: Holliday junction branch migration protein RuvA [Acidobacteria bacterium]|nr:Holliday junction branch migration protein RuvA [Acidobacteriota bacterium]
MGGGRIVIGYLTGEVVAVEQHTVTLNVGGVGYDVSVHPLVASAPIGAALELFVHTHVRDDAIVLFGFSSLREREMFRHLLATPGIGPSTAMGALATMPPEELAGAILREDIDAIATIPGIGKKTAARLVLELAGRLPALNDAVPSTSGLGDIESALRSLGYGTNEIRDALRDCVLPDDPSEALRLALKVLGRP